MAEVLDGPDLELDFGRYGEVHLAIRASGMQYAEAGPKLLAEQTADVLDRLRRDLPRQPERRLVKFPWGSITAF